MATGPIKLRRIVDIWIRRHEGETLKSIGDSQGVTPSRVRQLEMQAVRMIGKLYADDVKSGKAWPYHVQNVLNEIQQSDIDRLKHVHGSAPTEDKEI